MIEIIKEIIFNNWSNWFESSCPQNLSFVKIAGNSLPDGRLIFLVFADGSSSPCVVVKTSRFCEYDDSLETEFRSLEQVYKMCDSDFGIPKPLWFGEYKNRFFYIEAAIVGRLMGNMRRTWISYKEKNAALVENHINVALNWLTEFQLQTAVNFFTPENVDDLIKCLGFPEGQFSTTPVIKQASEKVIDYLCTKFVNTKVPLVYEHGDFWAGNLYLLNQNGKLGVVDWGDTQANRLPLYDATFFLVSYSLGFSTKDDNRLEVFESLLRNNSWYATVAHTYLNRYLAKVGLPDNLDPQMLFGYAVLRRSLIEENRPEKSSIYLEMLEYWLYLVNS